MATVDYRCVLSVAKLESQPNPRSPPEVPVSA